MNLIVKLIEIKFKTISFALFFSLLALSKSLSTEAGSWEEYSTEVSSWEKYSMEEEIDDRLEAMHEAALEERSRIQLESPKAFKFCLLYILCKEKNPNALDSLKKIFGDNIPNPNNFNSAVKAYNQIELAATNGNGDANLLLGIICENDAGSIQDRNDAIKYYKLSAKQGNIHAIKWFKLAAFNGMEEAEGKLKLLLQFSIDFEGSDFLS